MTLQLDTNLVKRDNNLFFGTFFRLVKLVSQGGTEGWLKQSSLSLANTPHPHEDWQEAC